MSTHWHTLSHTLCSCRDVTVKAWDLSDLLYILSLSHRYCRPMPLSTLSKSLTHMERRVCDLVQDKKKIWQKRFFKNVVSPKPLFSKICSTVYWRRESEALRQQADLLLTSWLMGRNMKQETVGWIFFTMLFQRPKISIISLIHSHVKTTVHLWIVALSSLFIKSGLKRNPLIQPLVMSQMVVLPLSC